MASNVAEDPKRIDGKAIAEQIHEELIKEVQQLKTQGKQPGLAVVLVRSDATVI
jgi:5,10-methylene-tetrahydrofolate dehydrogenase/methenyl tetrahydrofolate cyclohydrolase